MRWRMGRRSTNIEDRRGVRLPGRAAGGGIGILILIVIAILLGADPVKLLNDITSTGVDPTSSYDSAPLSDEDRELADFVSVVLADTEDTWSELFVKYNGRYREPTLVLFSGAVDSACGFAQSAVGPFYCPADEKVYIDLSFYRDLKERFDAPGDFAQAYVIAHEVGHHVQNLLGISEQVQGAQRRLGGAETNRLSVMQELQADCFAGVWAHNADRARDILEHGDIEEGLNAASSIGDDRLQMESQGRITPDSFTHGSSKQRVAWFKKGLDSGDIESCNTFEAKNL
ncbi:MAG: flagellar biosynthesis protein FlgM [Candidatus Dadabacteria bacterium RIFCSPHIGHO2_12_FULL_53_21]|nr:MAG: flagellar biosynthesis protein FlgM [Candidatus Dadabacteria bacterium RIFCSPHIGHO2_12_FULL_53_21]